jgi:hypothetical protein
MLDYWLIIAQNYYSLFYFSIMETILFILGILFLRVSAMCHQVPRTNIIQTTVANATEFGTIFLGILLIVASLYITFVPDYYIFYIR